MDGFYSRYVYVQLFNILPNSLKTVVPFNIPNSVREFLLSHIFIDPWWSVFFILASLMATQLQLIAVSVCTSLAANDVEHKSMCLFGIHMCHLVKCLFKSLTRFSTGWFMYLFMTVLFTVYVKALYKVYTLQIFSDSLRPFHSPISVFQKRKVIILMQSNILTFFLCFWYHI